jgi:hypothetical protein
MAGGGGGVGRGAHGAGEEEDQENPREDVHGCTDNTDEVVIAPLFPEPQRLITGLAKSETITTWHRVMLRSAICQK